MLFPTSLLPLQQKSYDHADHCTNCADEMGGGLSLPEWQCQASNHQAKGIADESKQHQVLHMLHSYQNRGNTPGNLNQGLIRVGS